MHMKVAVILPAAGLGTRMGKGSAEKTGTSRKQFMLLEGSPILIHTVRKFATSDRVAEIVVAVRAEDLEWVGGMLAREFPGRRVRAVAGGNSRQQSVENALATLGPETPLVAVHDAVRPFIDPETILKVFDEAAETGAAIVGVPVVDTVKQVSRATGRVRIRASDLSLEDVTSIERRAIADGSRAGTVALASVLVGGLAGTLAFLVHAGDGPCDHCEVRGFFWGGAAGLAAWIAVLRGQERGRWLTVWRKLE